MDVRGGGGGAQQSRGSGTVELMDARTINLNDNQNTAATCDKTILGAKTRARTVISKTKNTEDTVQSPFYKSH
jgi:hypothetical protein